MKALQLGSPATLDTLAVVDMPEPPAPGPGEIRVRLHASSLNYHDLAVVAGFIPASAGRIPLADGAGVVEAVGAGVAVLKPGDAVVSCFFPDWQDGAPTIGDFSRTPGDGIDGYGREWVVTPADWFTPAPRGYSHAQAATITTAGLTAWRALVVNGGLKPGDVVLALGTGGVSIYALQIAKAMGAAVLVTSSSDEKLDRAKALGADGVINYRQVPDWGDAVRKMTGGRGVDHVVEVGGAGTLGQSIAACRVGGHIAMIGVLSGRAGEVPTGMILRHQIRVEGVLVGSRRHQLDFVRALEMLPFKPVIDRDFPLDRAAEAFRYEMDGHHFGKIALSL